MTEIIESNTGKVWTEEKLDKLANEKIKESVEDEVKDMRYNEPKGKPQVSDELIHKTIDETEIYRQAKEYILNRAQPEQVGYGLDKYPEPLNADTWSIIETLDHIISESVDKLHYNVMLRIKLERLLAIVQEAKESCVDGPMYNIVCAIEELMDHVPNKTEHDYQNTESVPN